MNTPRVSVIIVSYNVQRFLDLCLDSVFRALRDVPSEVLVVDNNSADGSPEMVANRYPSAKLIKNKENAGFAKANNQAVALASGEYIHFLNPDTVLPEDFYSKTMAFLSQNPDAGCLGPRLIDGRGAFALDSKKAFPSFWTSVYKLSGISKLFSPSSKFNRYYRLDLPEKEIAEVEVLSGCCLLVRKEAIGKAGGSFDEGYFMYCEDVDLCYRIHLAGFKNYYFPEVSIIHYKGESTRKLSLGHMKIFHEAHVRFVKNYYPPKSAALYTKGLSVALTLRNFLHVGRHVFSLFKLFILETFLLAFVTLFIKNIWFENISKIGSLTFVEFLSTLLFFLFCWLGCLFLNGAYDKPFSLFKAGRGMLIGTLFVLAGYGLFPFDYRFSRAVVLLSGLMGFAIILLFRWLLGRLGWIPLVPRGKLNYKAALISDESHYLQTIAVLKTRAYYAPIIGRITPDSEVEEEGEEVLGSEKDIVYLQSQFKIDEFIFNGASTSYNKIIEQMQLCHPKAFYKIQASQSLAFVGSQTTKSSAEIYFVNQYYAIDRPSAKRNKRIMDILLSLTFIILFPILRFKVDNKKGFWHNINTVLLGKRTWVGYGTAEAKKGRLPSLRQAIVPPYKIIAGYQPGKKNKIRLSRMYARDFSVFDDLPIIQSNFRHLGSLSKK